MLSAEKREFLVSVVGEERTKVIEEELTRMERALQELGVGWKDDGVMVGRPLGGSTTFAQVDEFRKASEAAAETLDLVDDFRIIIANILDAELAPSEKASLLKGAASEFSKRVGALPAGEKAMLSRRILFKGGEPASKAAGPGAEGVGGYIDLLRGKPLDPQVQKAVDELEAVGRAGPYLADVVRLANRGN